LFKYVAHFEIQITVCDMIEDDKADE
jgi:hypothetical protein